MAARHTFGVFPQIFRIGLPQVFTHPAQLVCHAIYVLAK
jgi:hypothetical protein